MQNKAIGTDAVLVHGQAKELKEEQHIGGDRHHERYDVEGC